MFRLMMLSLCLILSSRGAQASALQAQNDSKTLRISLSERQNTSENIRGLLAYAKAEGSRQVILTPQDLNASPLSHVSTREEDMFPGGDLLFINGGLSDSDTDNYIRDTDYQAVSSAVKSASVYRFRVIIQLYATTYELRQAFQATRPTIVIWSGHGGQDGTLYDSTGLAIPTDVFKNISPNVYQLIISSCFSRFALKKYQVPSSIQTKTWTEETTSQEMADYLESDAWDIFANRKSPLSYHGLTCVKTSGGVQMQNEQGEVLVGTNREMSFNLCAYLMLSSNSGFTCAPTGSGVDIISLITKQVVKGVSFDNTIPGRTACVTKVRQAVKGSICRRLKRDENIYGVVQAKDGQVLADPQFKNIEDCIKFTETSQEI